MLARLVAAVTAGEFTVYLAGLRQRLMLYALAGVFALCGIGFFIGAGYIATEQEIGSFYAAIWFGIGFFVLAILVFVILRIVAAVRRRHAAQRRGAEVRTLASTAALALVPALLSRSPLLILAPLAAVLGYGIYRENSGSGRNPHIRD
jgi:uncharacterized membrane protein YhaH (DUF805 family)